MKKTNIKEVEVILGTTEYLLSAYANPSPIIRNLLLISYSLTGWNVV